MTRYYYILPGNNTYYGGPSGSEPTMDPKTRYPPIFYLALITMFHGRSHGRLQQLWRGEKMKQKSNPSPPALPDQHIHEERLPVPQVADHGRVPNQSRGFHQGGHELRGAASVRQLKSPRMVFARGRARGWMGIHRGSKWGAA